MLAKSGIMLLITGTLAAQTWLPVESNTRASLRGLHAVSDDIVWFSGTGGAGFSLRSQRQASGLPPELDFRDVHALDERRAWLLSIGPGAQSRVYRTVDGGAHWQLQLTNPDAEGFFDQFAFWDERRGILVGDPVGGRLVVMTTNDAGEHWQRREMPPALPGEGTFAASGSAIFVRGASEVWIGTGGKGAVRVYHSRDGGRTWTVAPAPLRSDSASAGIFSLCFADSEHGIAVGGDYTKPNETAGNIAVTSDGGATWTVPPGSPSGFRSAVVWVATRKVWITTGTNGSDISRDGGRTWKQFDSGAYNSLSVAGDTAWAAGPRGRLARLSW